MSCDPRAVDALLPGRIGQLTEQEKDLEILLLRQQLGIAQRKLNKPVPSSRVERLTIAVVATKLKSATGRTTVQLRQVIRIFQPETVLRWHRQLVRWRHLMRHYKDQILACDFFTAETIFLKSIYVLFFIELGNQRVHFAGCTTNPSGSWVTQQTRQLVWDLEDREPRLRFLIHDRDSKFTDAFDAVFRSEGVKIVLTPARAPNANSIAERWVRPVRTESLDKLLIFNQSHLRSVMSEHVDYYNTARPHQGIDLQTPICQTTQSRDGPIRCRNILGGIIHDYLRKAA